MTCNLKTILEPIRDVGKTIIKRVLFFKSVLVILFIQWLLFCMKTASNLIS